VWCRSALGADVLERQSEGFRLAEHLDTLLLDNTSPSYLGGAFSVLEQSEVFDRFERHLASGERMWWDDTSPEWIAGVGETGTLFYTRLVGGLDQIPAWPNAARSTP
jgi:hypothetical protein